MEFKFYFLCWLAISVMIVWYASRVFVVSRSKIVYAENVMQKQFLVSIFLWAVIAMFSAIFSVQCSNISLMCPLALYLFFVLLLNKEKRRNRRRYSSFSADAVYPFVAEEVADGYFVGKVVVDGKVVPGFLESSEHFVDDCVPKEDFKQRRFLVTFMDDRLYPKSVNMLFNECEMSEELEKKTAALF